MANSVCVFQGTGQIGKSLKAGTQLESAWNETLCSRTVNGTVFNYVKSSQAHMSKPLFYVWLFRPPTPTPFQDSVDVSRTAGGDLLPLHLVVRRRRQRRPSLVRAEPPLMFSVWLTSPRQWWISMNGLRAHLNACQPFFFFSFHRGDPTWVKINVAITTGYLISGKRNVQWPTFVIVTPKLDKCGNYTIKWIQIFRRIQT